MKSAKVCCETSYTVLNLVVIMIYMDNSNDGKSGGGPISEFYKVK